MEALDMEFVVMMGVVANTLIQAYWLSWTLKNHRDDKHGD